MATMNIANRGDPFYRYKMPRIISKIEGKGNGIKTVVPNMPEIAKALERDPAYPTKFFGFELGAQTKIDLTNNKYIVNGAHDAERLQDVMDMFIKKYVLCGSCGNPETDLIVKKDEIIKRCKACGKDTQTDKTHKCTAYIVKNPPADHKKKDKFGRGPKSPKDGVPTPPDSTSHDSEASDDELTKRIEKEAAELPELPDGENGDEDWAEDDTPEAVAKRQAELSAGLSEAVAKMALADDDEDGEDDPDLAKLSSYVRTTPSATDEEIVEKAKELYIKDYKSLTVLPAALFGTSTADDVKSAMAARKGLFTKLIKSEKGQKSVLGGFEKLFKENAELMAKVPILLKWLYDEDVVEEDVFIGWGEKPSKKFVDKATSKDIKAKAKPFLDWLQQPEEDDSEEEESDD